jgi:flagellar FlgN protein
MSKENTAYLDLLKRRIELMNSLSAELLAARSAIVAIDIDGLESRIAQQRQLCAEIKKIDEQRERLQFQCGAQFRLRRGEETLANPAGFEEALLRLHHAQANLKQLNAEHEALLTRSRRTVTALLNSLYTSEGAYRTTALQQTSALAGRREEA